MVPRDADIPASTGGVLMGKVLGFIKQSSSSEQERRGDRRLEEARALIEENRLVIAGHDLEVLQERIAT